MLASSAQEKIFRQSAEFCSEDESWKLFFGCRKMLLQCMVSAQHGERVPIKERGPHLLHAGKVQGMHTLL